MNEPSSERSRSVSESSIWKLLMDFYARSGPDAWRSGRVPQRITSNGHMADVYASLVAAFLRDWHEDGHREVPLILEVGGGSGLFAWLFLNRLLRHHIAEDQELTFEYLLTDGAASNVEAWMQVPRMRRLVDEGPLELAVLRADGQLRCDDPRTRGFEPADLVGRPVVVIANYAFDSLPTELVRIREGRVFRESLSIKQPGPGSVPGKDFNGLEPHFTSHELAAPYTAHEGVNEIIDRYRELGREVCVPVPLQAIAFLESFLRTDFPVLVLSGDLAYTTTDFDAEPPIVFTDYIACTVNFHMLGQIVEGWGGEAVFADRADSEFSVGAFLKPGSTARLPRTREAARNVLRHFTPHDAHQIETALEHGVGALDFGSVFAWLRFARFDAYVTSRCIPRLVQLLEEGETVDRAILHQGLLQSFRCALPGVSEEDDGLDVQIAYVLVKAKMYRETYDFLVESIAELGGNAERLHLLGLAAARLGREPESAQRLREALEVEPGYWDALAGKGRRPAEVVSWLLGQSEDDVHLNHIVLRLAVAEFMRLDASKPAG